MPPRYRAPNVSRNSPSMRFASGETTFALADDSTVRTFFPDATIQTTGGKVELVLPAKGFMMFFR